MSSRVTPAEIAGQDGSSGRSRSSLPQPRRQSMVNQKILQNGLSLRQLSHATKIFQSELDSFFEKSNDISYNMLETLVKTKLIVRELWAKAFLTKWRPTQENKRVLAENILQSCMIYLRSVSIGRPDPRKVLQSFGVSVVLDVFEFVAVANVFVFFFYLNEVTLGWILLGCLIFERVLQFLGSLAFENISMTSVLASLLGFKTFLTSYFIACLGPITKIEGSKVYLVTSRFFHKGVNGIFLLSPQALLNAYSAFSKLKAEEEITSTIRIQIFVILAVCFSVGASLTKLQQESERQHAKNGYYKSMTQIHSKDSDQLGMAILKGSWNICHFMLVTCALGALMAKTPPYVWISIIVGFFFILNVIRYMINKGEMRLFLRIGSSWSATFGAVFIPSIVFVCGVGLMPLSFLRWHCVLGPTVYGVGWMSSFLISSISLLYLSSNLFLRIVFGVLIGMYVVIALSYLRYLKPEARTTFFWSNDNWKDILSTEWLENPHYESDEWEDIHLIGDKDANYAGMVQKFLNADLPWGKLVSWLKEKKTTFKQNPPTWLSEDWLKLIPENRRNEVWNEREYLELCETIRRFEQKFKTETIRARSMLENVDNREIQNDGQEREGERRLPEEERAVQQERNALRQKVIENIKKRRSSFLGSLNALPTTTDSEEKDIPEMLKTLFAKSEFLEIDEIIQESKLVLNNGLLDILVGPQKNASAEDIVLMILRAFLCERKKQKKKENITEGVPRILLAAFFELFDEISDIILAGLFYADADNKRWAGHLMFVFMGLNRLMQGLFSLSYKESKWRVCEGLIGIKGITDTYRMIRDGPLAISGGRPLVSIRAFSLGIGVTCESLPQMMLQVFIVLSAFKSKKFETGIFIAQVTSVMFSCISIGLSLATVYVDTALSHAIPGKEIHKSCYKFLPRDDKFRQTVILVSMTMIKASHLLLAIFGFGALFSYAPIPG
eukprot:g340.t1